MTGSPNIIVYFREILEITTDLKLFIVYLQGMVYVLKRQNTQSKTDILDIWHDLQKSRGPIDSSLWKVQRVFKFANEAGIFQ